MHVAVVGGGVMGAAIAWRLAVRGHTVTVVEPFGFGHAGSASGDRSRIVRALYDEPSFAASGHASLALWDAWARELGEPLVERAGVLYLADAGDAPSAIAFRAWLERGVANVRALGGAVEELAPRDIARRFPAIATEGLARGVLEPGGGF
ncbi:MAG TPA: FAD-dependent oxidoreductase, partial [Minicystis sp.]|nr:FAD-dependent oxidoreductase [Minicystis sp.]